MSSVFLDTSYAIALSAPNDEHHLRALEIAERLEAEGARLITTRAVLLEIGNALSKARHRQAAIKLLDALEGDPHVEIVSIGDVLYRQAFELYRSRPDKEWGLVDCVSFVTMSERNMQDALTADDHFRQAGFRVLLQESQSCNLAKGGNE